MNLWDYDETTLESLGIDVPKWIDSDISCYDVAAIIQGGCDSGAYMPAVTYSDALKTMSELGDDVFNYLDDFGGLDEPISVKDMSWAGLACYFLSSAVKTWAASVEEEVQAALEEREREEA